MPQKLGHNEFFSVLYFYRKPLSFCKSMYLKTGQILGVGFPQNLLKFCICLGFCFRFCFIRKVHREAFLKSTYKYCRIFESLKNLIELCMYLIDVFEDWKRKLMIMKLGILHIMDSSLSKLILARYVCCTLN